MKVGAKSIKATYSGYGGINLKHSRGGVDASNLIAVRLWVKGDSTVNGPGNPTLQMRVNSQEHDFEIVNDDWSIYQLPLALFESPSIIEAIVIQNRQSSDLLAYIDQIELIAADETDIPTIFPSAIPTSLSTASSRNPSHSPMTLVSDPTSPPSINPTGYPSQEVTNSPSFQPTIHSTGKPSSHVSVIVC